MNLNFLGRSNFFWEAKIFCSSSLHASLIQQKKFLVHTPFVNHTKLMAAAPLLLYGWKGAHPPRLLVLQNGSSNMGVDGFSPPPHPRGLTTPTPFIRYHRFLSHFFSLTAEGACLCAVSWWRLGGPSTHRPTGPVPSGREGWAVVRWKQGGPPWAEAGLASVPFSGQHSY